MNKKILLFTSIGMVFATGVAALSISGANQMNKLKVGSANLEPNHSITFDASKLTSGLAFDDDSWEYRATLSSTTDLSNYTVNKARVYTYDNSYISVGNGSMIKYTAPEEVGDQTYAGLSFVVDLQNIGYVLKTDVEVDGHFNKDKVSVTVTSYDKDETHAYDYYQVLVYVDNNQSYYPYSQDLSIDSVTINYYC